MPSAKIVRTRSSGWCDSDFAHPGEIRVGDRIQVVTYFPSDENVRVFSALALKRYRHYTWCLSREEEQRSHR